MTDTSQQNFEDVAAMLVAEQLHKRPKMGSLVPNPAYDPTGVDGLGTTMQALAAVEATESGLREGVSADVVCAEPFGAFPDVRPQPVGPLSPLSCPPLASYGADDFDKVSAELKQYGFATLGPVVKPKPTTPARESRRVSFTHAATHSPGGESFRQVAANLWVKQAQLCVNGTTVTQNAAQNASGSSGRYMNYHEYKASLPLATTPAARRVGSIVDSDDSSDDDTAAQEEGDSVCPPWPPMTEAPLDRNDEGRRAMAQQFINAGVSDLNAMRRVFASPDATQSDALVAQFATHLTGWSAAYVNQSRCRALDLEEWLGSTAGAAAALPLAAAPGTPVPPPTMLIHGSVTASQVSAYLEHVDTRAKLKYAAVHPEGGAEGAAKGRAAYYSY